MPRLSPCPSCRVHVLVDDRECPHCGATLRTTGASRVAVVAMGLTLAGCPDPAPLYGATDSFDDDTTDATETSPPDTSTGISTTGISTTGISTTTGETDAMTGTTTAGSSTGMADSTSGGTGDTDATAGSTSVGEPDYGVPESSS